MKKFYILILLGVMLGIGYSFHVDAEAYTNFQEIVFDHDDAYLLRDYSDTDLSDSLKKIKKKKFIGWRIIVINKNEELEFVAETKLKVSNDGYSAIEHDILLETDVEEKLQLSCSGGIKLSGKGDVKKFKGSIDADIKASVDYSKLTSSHEEYSFKIKVDPLTSVRIVIMGEGRINNGVGKYYFFWVNTKTGGWETFTQTTEYYEIVKERL